MTKLDGRKKAYAVFLLCAATAIASPAKTTVKTLVKFDGANGAEPFAENLVQGEDGNLYGTTTYDGTDDDGTVFKVTPSGTVTILHKFTGMDGANPYAGLVLGVDGNFYGTTYEGGTNDYGTVFKITSTGTLTTLHVFADTDGGLPYGALVQGTDGNFYGTTEVGGAHGAGTVFRITPAGKLKTLYSFCAQASCDDGDDPYAGLVQGTDGDFYGTTVGGGTHNVGTVFKITSTGTLTTLHSFDVTDGWEPEGQLIQASNGILYGTTVRGGTHNMDAGTVFQITPAGALTNLYSFCAKASCDDGTEPADGLVQATNGDLYGTTYAGGTAVNEAGTVFQITLGGKLNTLYNFNVNNGAYPFGGLLQHTNGIFYGVTGSGGNLKACIGGCGIVFSMDAVLGAFVKLLPASGDVGAAVTILGTNLTGATSVSFNGTAAKFEVVSSSEITTTVPAGATTGEVEVPIPSQSSDISTCSWASGTAICTVASAAGFGVGYPLTIAGVTPSGYNVTGVLISGINGNQISYALASNPGPSSSGGMATESSVTLVSNVVFRVNPQ